MCGVGCGKLRARRVKGGDSVNPLFAFQAGRMSKRKRCRVLVVGQFRNSGKALLVADSRYE